MSKIYICTHKDFDCPVSNPVYQVVDVRKTGDVASNGLRGAFYSELLTYKRIANRRRNHAIVGFCGYRKYFEFMDDVPNLDMIINDYGCIVTKKEIFNVCIREQYEKCLNVEDLDIITDIINKDYPEFSKAFNAMLRGNAMYTCNMFIMKIRDFKEMMAVVWDILDKYLNVVGLDIEKRIRDNRNKYIHKYSINDESYHYRLGGHLGERIISAWLMWKFPNAKTYNMVMV